MTPAQRKKAIRFAARRKPKGMPIVTYFHLLAAQQHAGPMTREEQALSDQAAAEVGDVLWYHGGLPGRAVGDLLLPAKATGSDPRGQNTATPDRSWAGTGAARPRG